MCNAEKRLKLIAEDLELFVGILKKNNISYSELTTDDGTEAETLLNNIRIATNMNDAEADNWSLYNK